MTKKKKSKKNQEYDVYEKDNYVIEEELSIACKDAMNIFYANTNLMRQISNLVDGLKPVQRRILVSMFNLGLRPKSKPIKSVKIVAETMDKYHPHGDASIYGALVKMAQWWSTRYILAQPLSIFGTQSGKPAAAFRYTETTFSEFAYDAYFTEYNLDNVLTKPTFDRTGLEPEYLPSKYPMALLLGCFGIGQGIQVGIPPFRPDQVFDKAIELLDNPMYDDALMMPDSATFCNIVDDGQLEEVCRTGNGKLRYQSNIEIDREKHRILIKTLPPQVVMRNVEKKIIELHEKGILKGYADIINANYLSPSKDDGGSGRIIKFRKEADLDEAANVLLKYAGLTKTLSVNFVYLDNYKEVNYGVLDYLREWIEYRREFKQINFSKKLIYTVERLHNLETLLMIFTGKNAEKALKVARSSSKDTLEKYLMDEFGISSLQARSIAGMSISSFTADNMQKLREEKAKLEEYRAELKKLLDSTKKIDKIIKKELLEGKAKYGSDVRSKIITLDGEDGIANTRHLVLFTSEGHVKKLPHDSTSLGYIEPGDNPREVTFVDNRDELMIFDSSGKAHKLPVHKIANSNLDERGDNLSKHINLKGKIRAVIPKPTKNLDIEPNTNFVVLLTANGTIKKTDIINYQNMRSELVAMSLDKGDEVVDVKLMAGDQELLCYTNKGMGNRFSSEEVRETGRSSKGILAIEMESGEKAKGFEIIHKKDKYILCFTDKGKAKKCTMESFRTMKRNSKALRLLTLDRGEKVLLIKTIKGKEELVVFMKNEVHRVDAKEIDILPRMAKANKIIPVKRGDMIIDVRVDN